MATSEQYGVYRDALIRLHELIAEGQGDSPQADALRDEMDGTWVGLAPSEIKFIRLLSADLYGPNSDAKDHNSVVEIHRILQEAKFYPTQSEQWQNVHRALKRCEGLFPANIVLFYKSRIWNGFGDPISGLWFIRRSLEIEPKDANIQYLYLQQLLTTNPSEAFHRAKEISDSADAAALVLFKAADILFVRAQEAQNTPANEFLAIIQLYNKAFKVLARTEPNKVPVSVQYGARVYMGIAWKRLGDFAQAENSFSVAIKMNVDVSLALVSRGILNYGRKTEDAVSDFEKAIQFRVGVVWPYFFMAHWTLMSCKFEKCIEYCGAASRFPHKQEVEAELIQWKTMSQFFLTGDSNKVLEKLQLAQTLSPQNKWIRQNLAEFGTLIQTTTPHNWSIPQEVEVSNLADSEWQPVINETEHVEVLA